MHGKRQQKLCEDYVKSGPKNNPFDFYYDFKSNCQQKTHRKNKLICLEKVCGYNNSIGLNIGHVHTRHITIFARISSFCLQLFL